MADPSVSEEPGPAKVGRPARINREMIAATAHEIGLDGLTLRAVADHLGVSIAALYHHVSGKDDLMRAAAEHAAGLVPLPQDTGQHWAVWLLEWAFYNHDIFATRPGLLAEYLDGAIGAEMVAPSLDRIIAGLVRQGFTPLEADAAYQLMAATAIGSVVNEQRTEQILDVPRDYLDQLPHLRAALDAGARQGPPTFEARIETALRGIAAERGEDWAPIRTDLRRLARRRRRA